jgi:hypothetical protein
MIEILIDFALPALVLLILLVLLLCGIDGEVKSLLAAVVGWLLKSGYSHRHEVIRKNHNQDALQSKSEGIKGDG